MSAATGFMQSRAGERAAGCIVHVIGTLAGVVGSAMLVGIAASVDRPAVEAGATFTSPFRGRPNSLTALVGGGARYLVDYYRKAAIARD
jgi:hypothetical protein